uniref:Uncharacterized protein n=1 Tax=Glossina pallidipes TaxID=7398 RepID=A0A1A9ZAD9_GLOPL
MQRQSSQSAVGITNDILVVENSVANMLNEANDSNSTLKAPKPATAMAVSKSVPCSYLGDSAILISEKEEEEEDILLTFRKTFLLSYTYRYVAHYSDFKRVAKASASKKELTRLPFPSIILFQDIALK